MKMHRFLFPCWVLFTLIIIAGSCNKERLVVPYEVDADEVFKAIEPNDENQPSQLTFGSDSIPGTTIDYEVTSDNSEIYIFFENLTMLNIAPQINQDIFDFIDEQLDYFGFTDKTTISRNESYISLIKNGFSYSEATSEILNEISKDFESRLDTIMSFQSPFNIHFQIYPVYLSGNILTYRQTAYSYTGGAHGITVSYLKSYDLQNGSLLKLDDIVKPEEIEYVREEVVSAMAYLYPIYDNITTVGQYIDSLNSWLGDSYGEEASEHDNRITLNNYPLPDPGITKDGLAFIYQMYVLTPGSSGCPLVVIPYKDLKGSLTESLYL